MPSGPYSSIVFVFIALESCKKYNRWILHCKIKIQTVIYSPNFYFFLSFRNTAQRVLQAVYSRKRFQLHVAHIKKAHFWKKTLSNLENWFLSLKNKIQNVYLFKANVKNNSNFFKSKMCNYKWVLFNFVYMF